MPSHASPDALDLSNEQLIDIWQSFRRAARTLGDHLVTALRGTVHHDEMWCEALAQLARAPQTRLSMTELGAALGITSGAITKLVDRLADDQLVQREHATADRRMVYAVLTKRGHEAEQLTTPVYADNLRSDLGGLGTQRLLALKRLSDELEQTLACD